MSSTLLPQRMHHEMAQQRWTDEAVSLACNSADPVAVAELFDRFQAPVTRFLSRLVARVDVEDLVQSVFLQVARGRARYDGRASAKTWLFAVAANMARQHYRKAKYHRQLLWTLTHFNKQSVDDRASSQVDARRSARAVCVTFDSMSENARLAFVLCELDGVTALEAAKILHTSEAAVWKRVSDVRRALLKATEGRPKVSSLPPRGAHPGFFAVSLGQQS